MKWVVTFLIFAGFWFFLGYGLGSVSGHLDGFRECAAIVKGGGK